MKIRKKLAAALALFTLTASSAIASAEHPSAQRYREMLRSDNFYLEYEMVDDSKKKSASLAAIPGMVKREALSSKEGKRLASSVPIERKKKMGLGSFIIGFNIGDSKTKTKRGARTPKALFVNDNYYIFQPQGGQPFINTVFTMASIGQIMEQAMNKNPKLEARVCPATRLNDPKLDPTECWKDVRSALELPDALTVFTDDDPYQDQKGRVKINIFMLGEISFLSSYRDYTMPPRTEPKFLESRKVTLEKNEYDCDRYVANIKTVGGTVAGQVLYDVFYDGEGNLSQIRRYFSRNGKEEYLGTMEICELTAELPDDAFFISTEPIKTYAAGMGDANDFLGIDVQVGTIGGASTNGK